MSDYTKLHLTLNGNSISYGQDYGLYKNNLIIVFRRIIVSGDSLTILYDDKGVTTVDLSAIKNTLISSAKIEADGKTIDYLPQILY